MSSQLNTIVINITLDGQNYPKWAFCVETAIGVMLLMSKLGKRMMAR